MRKLLLMLLLPVAVNAGELSGEQAFATCQACHSLEPGNDHRVGPSLHGVFGRPVAALPDYNYSQALLESGLTWDRATLITWIVATERMVPGTHMQFHNYLESAEVSRLVDYLIEVTGKR